jgi:hypothetical protein
MGNVSDKSCRRNRNAHFVFNNFIFENLALYQIMWKNTEERGWLQMTIWRICISCWIAKATQALTICNTFSFSTATVVARTRLSVTLYANCLFCLILGPVSDRNVNPGEGHSVSALTAGSHFGHLHSLHVKHMFGKTDVRFKRFN